MKLAPIAIGVGVAGLGVLAFAVNKNKGQESVTDSWKRETANPVPIVRGYEYWLRIEFNGKPDAVKDVMLHAPEPAHTFAALNLTPAGTTFLIGYSDPSELPADAPGNRLSTTTTTTPEQINGNVVWLLVHGNESNRTFGAGTVKVNDDVTATYTEVWSREAH